MDKQLEPPSRPPILGGQLGLGLSGEARPQRLRVAMAGAVKKETLLEEIFAFAKGFLFYCQRRLLGTFRLLWRTFVSSFIFSSDLKSHLQGKLYRKKGQLSFPLAHASLLGISFSLLFFTSGFGESLYRPTSANTSGEGAVIVADQPAIATEESELFQTKAQTYIVQEGDTLQDIAEQFHITIDALAYANQIDDPSYKPRPGEKLTIPPIEGLTYEVRAGDTIELIAERYQVDFMNIADFNYLFAPFKLTAGQELTIPYAQVPSSESAGIFLGWLSTPPVGKCDPDLSLSWPTTSREILSRFGYRIDPFLHRPRMHKGIDLEAHSGDPLYAAADGTVTAVDGNFRGRCYCMGCRSCNFGYGGYVFVDIGGGYQLRYAHILTSRVGVGQEVKRGDLIATAGDTGRATGNHLHFELVCNGVSINPLLPYLQ